MMAGGAIVPTITCPARCASVAPGVNAGSSPVTADVTGQNDRSPAIATVSPAPKNAIRESHMQPQLRKHTVGDRNSMPNSFPAGGLYW